ncbi:ig-like domain-containing protein [Trichonephila inaurata madagascariensis]|uniref:Ig-like domain-containing protein n=1 Tax=Trichonephila inaurata madagascariensis TaxID=2747483 RepID=A0A8X7CEH8_9ARAC|nr:ig-like domain-containing protein [Trichonephila inaurata madagascariensis]
MSSLTVALFLINCLFADSHLTLTIIPFGKDIVLEENADLNLTCRVVTKERANTRYELSWKLPTRSNTPSKSNGNGDRITVYQRNDQLTVTIHNLQEDDKVHIFFFKKSLEPFFDWGKSCISKHYVCDGYVDCPSGYDEAFKYCGQDACHGKILCDGRCIPKEMCCDSSVEPNCTANYVMPCLYQYGAFHGDVNPSPCSSSEDCHYFGFGNSILYIVASCAGVIMIVSTVIMFLACRICSRHSEELQRWARVPTSGMHRQYLQGVTALRDSDSTDNIDFLFEDINSDVYQGNSGSESPDDFVLLNFVPGYGFEIADCGPKPPPYTENVIGIPPPPYESSNDVSESNKNVSPEESTAAQNDETPNE